MGYRFDYAKHFFEIFLRAATKKIGRSHRNDRTQ